MEKHVKALTEFPPLDLKQLQRFLGLIISIGASFLGSPVHSSR
jgi:hypothetical protein